MRIMIVDDEPLMLRRFVRLCEGIPALTVAGQFESAKEALCFAEENDVEAAFLDVAMPGMSGVELANALRAIKPDIVIVFVSAYEDYLWDFNRIGGDYYLLKPYDREMLAATVERARLIAQRQRKKLFVRTFGRFMVLRDGQPLDLTGKAKEILALVIAKRGREISNESIYCTLWEGRPLGNDMMSVYYNALGRLKKQLRENGAEELLISTRRGQMADTSMIDCDYYDWLDGKRDPGNRFEGEFLSEYSWGEELLAELMRME